MHSWYCSCGFSKRLALCKPAFFANEGEIHSYSGNYWNIRHDERPRLRRGHSSCRMSQLSCHCTAWLRRAVSVLWSEQIWLAIGRIKSSNLSAWLFIIITSSQGWQIDSNGFWVFAKTPKIKNQKPKNMPSLGRIYQYTWKMDKICWNQTGLVTSA